MHKQFQIGQLISFTIPYFESQFYYNGEIQEVKGNSLIVRFSNYVEDSQGFQYIIHDTEIPLAAVVN